VEHRGGNAQGDREAALVGEGALWLISLQALAIGDEAVLRGWQAEAQQPDLVPGDRIVIVRPRARLERGSDSAPCRGVAGGRHTVLSGSCGEGSDAPGLSLSCYRQGPLPAE
jgi:hypothetical protein